MRKEEYLDQLRWRLNESGIPNTDQMVGFYAEMIEDRVEDGMTEEEAVDAMEDIDSIVNHAKEDIPITSLVTARVKESHENAKKKGNGSRWMVLAILGFPVWFPLMVAFFAVLLAFFAVLWAVVIVVFAVVFSFGIAAVVCLVAGFGVFFGWIPFATTIASWGCALILGGLLLLLWKPACRLTEGLIRLIRGTYRRIKGWFAGKH